MVTSTQVACLVSRESRSGLRYLAERTGVALSCGLLAGYMGRVPLHLGGGTEAVGRGLRVVDLRGQVPRYTRGFRQPGRIH